MKKRSSAHISAQRAGRARDFQTCQVCGSTKNPQGHHILDHMFSGGAHKDNIITLCNGCHKKAHKGLFDIFKF